MSSSKKCKYKRSGDAIHIRHPDWGALYSIDYREDIESELTNINWSLNGQYLRSAKLGMMLHQYVMRKWYGDDVVNDAYESGFVIDHINNDCKYDNRLCNLEFLLKRYNTAKGQELDRDVPEILNRVALRIFKDFLTGKYQITMGFNVPTYKNVDGHPKELNAIKLLYNSNYRQVLIDAASIINMIRELGGFNLQKLNHESYREIYTEYLVEKPGEDNALVIERDGELFLRKSPHVRMHTVNYDKGWK